MWWHLDTGDCLVVTILYFQMKTNAWWEEQSASSSVSISLAVSTVTVTKVTTLMTSCLTSVWTLTSVSKAHLIATRALILKEGNKTSVCVSVLQCQALFSSLFSLDYLATCPSHATFFIWSRVVRKTDQWADICMGYWPSVRSRWLDIGQVLLFRVYGPRRHGAIGTRQKWTRKYPAILTEQAWTIKDLLYDFRWNFSCGTRWVVPSVQDSSILPAQVANYNAVFDSSCPLAELAIYNKGS